MTPVRCKRWSKPCAIRTASCPVMPSATSRISSGFTASLSRSSSAIISASFSQHRGELVVDDLHQLLRRRDGAQLRHAERPFFDALEEFPGQLKVDVGLE